MSNSAEFPPSIQAALASPVLERRAWQDSIGPNYIALFLWVVYFDSLANQTLSVGGLASSVLGAVVAGLLCYKLLYYVPAMWGFQVGRPLPVVTTSTFGLHGSSWLAVVLLGMGQVVWAAVATYYATDLCLKGLVVLGLLDTRALATRPWKIGGVTRTLGSPLFLITVVSWSYTAALVGHYFVRPIAALMRVFPIFLAFLLGMTMLMTIRGLSQYQPPGVDPATLAPIRDGGPRAFVMMIQLVFGFFATAGLAAADWGMVGRDERDIRLGGWVGVAFASSIVATLALLTVAGARGLEANDQGPGIQPGFASHAYQDAVISAIGGPLAGLVLLGFGLASLAPTCYATFVFSHRFAAAWPRWKRLRWTLLGTAVSCVLIIAGVASRLETIFGIMGAVFAPMAGAMAADYYRQGGRWPGARRGVNPAGVAAWAAGLAVGLVPTIAAAWGQSRAAQFQPASVFAFVTAFLTYTILARLGLEPPVVPLPEDAALVKSA